jgi:hypothetical protein
MIEVRARGQHLRDRGESAVAAEPQIEKDDVELTAVERLDRTARAADAEHATAVGFETQSH